jgi:hypothetical protein
MRFRKSVKIAPGVRLNFSKSGVSGTFGVKGASVNVGKNGAYLNTGIPGNGIYKREKIGDGASSAADAAWPDIVPIGKTGRRVFTVLGILIMAAALAALFTGHWIIAILVGGFGLGTMFAPSLSALANQS